MFLHRWMCISLSFTLSHSFLPFLLPVSSNSPTFGNTFCIYTYTCLCVCMFCIFVYVCMYVSFIYDIYDNACICIGSIFYIWKNTYDFEGFLRTLMCSMKSQSNFLWFPTVHLHSSKEENSTHGYILGQIHDFYEPFLVIKSSTTNYIWTEPIFRMPNSRQQSKLPTSYTIMATSPLPSLGLLHLARGWTVSFHVFAEVPCLHVASWTQPNTESSQLSCLQDPHAETLLCLCKNRFSECNLPKSSC
jgi:hypothetical protein